MRGGQETVLLVDDEKAVLEVVRTALTDYGYRVIIADCGKAALEIMARSGESIDLVVFNLDMPSMSAALPDRAPCGVTTGSGCL